MNQSPTLTALSSFTLVLLLYDVWWLIFKYLIHLLNKYDHNDYDYDRCAECAVRKEIGERESEWKGMENVIFVEPLIMDVKISS